MASGVPAVVGIPAFACVLALAVVHAVDGVPTVAGFHAVDCFVDAGQHLSAVSLTPVRNKFCCANVLPVLSTPAARVQTWKSQQLFEKVHNGANLIISDRGEADL